MRLTLPGSAALGLLLVLAVRADVAVPELTARVTDLTGTLSTAEQAALEQKLADFEARKGSQVAVLIVPTTRPEAIEQYSLRVVDAWKVGRKNVDDGALLIVAKQDRELRIEVGYGLEGVLNDAVSRRIIDETIVPSFRRGVFYGGIDAGVDRMLAVIDGEPLPEPDRRQQGPPLEGLLPIIPVILIFTVVLGSILKSIFGQLPGALMTGGLVTAFTWMLLGILAASVVAGVAAFVLTLFSRHQPGRWSSRGGGPGWSGGSGGGFGGAGGGFGGGGGGFGGGGASGRW